MRRRYLEVCCGVLRWPPAVFWASTMVEIAAAVDGYIESHGPPADEFMSREELEELKARYA